MPKKTTIDVENASGGGVRRHRGATASAARHRRLVDANVLKAPGFAAHGQRGAEGPPPGGDPPRRPSRSIEKSDHRPDAALGVEVAAWVGAQLDEACEGVKPACAVGGLWVSDGARAHGADGSTAEAVPAMRDERSAGDRARVRSHVGAAAHHHRGLRPRIDLNLRHLLDAMPRRGARAPP